MYFTPHRILNGWSINRLSFSKPMRPKLLQIGQTRHQSTPIYLYIQNIKLVWNSGTLCAGLEQENVLYESIVSLVPVVSIAIVSLVPVVSIAIVSLVPVVPVVLWCILVSLVPVVSVVSIVSIVSVVSVVRLVSVTFSCSSPA